MSGLSFHAHEFFQLANMTLGPLISCAILLAAILLFSSDHRSHMLCLVIGAAISMAMSFVNSVLWFPNLGIFAQGKIDPTELNRILGYFGGAALLGRILFGYGLLMLGIVRFKLSRAPDFQRK